MGKRDAGAEQRKRWRDHLTSTHSILLDVYSRAGDTTEPKALKRCAFELKNAGLDLVHLCEALLEEIRRRDG